MSKSSGRSYEIWWGLYVGLCVNLAVGGVGRLFEPSVSAWFVVYGVANEVLGVLLVASPELLRRVTRVGRVVLARLGDWLHRFSLFLHRVLRIPRHDVTHTSRVSSSLTMPFNVIGAPGEPPSALDERVEWLIEQYHDLHERLSENELAVQRLPEQWREDIGKTRSDLESMQDALERRLADARIHLRLLGVAFVIGGLVLAGIGGLL